MAFKKKQRIQRRIINNNNNNNVNGEYKYKAHFTNTNQYF